MWGNKELDHRIAAMVDSISKLTVAVEKIGMQHQTLSQDHDALGRRVEVNETQIRNLQQNGAKIETVSKLAQWGGLALIGAIVGSWASLSNRVDTTAAKTESNTQALMQLQTATKDNEASIADIQKRVTDNREAILTELKRGSRNER